MKRSAVKSTTMHGESAKKSRTRQKWKLTAKAAMKHYSDEMHYAVIDNKGSDNLAKDHLETIEDIVNNDILDPLLDDDDPITITSSEKKDD